MKYIYNNLIKFKNDFFQEKYFVLPEIVFFFFELKIEARILGKQLLILYT